MSYGTYAPHNQPPPNGGYYGQPPPPQGGYGYQQPGQYGPPPGQPPYGAPYGGPSPTPPQGQFPPYNQSGYGAPPPMPPRPVELYGSPPPVGNTQSYYQQSPPPPGPPPAQFGGPPAPYGGAPGYGAPGYGAPGYGAPPPVSYPTPPSPGYGAPQIINWDPNPTAKALFKAMKGWGTDEAVLIRELADKDPWQIHALNDAYRRNHNRDLGEHIASETRGWFEDGLLAIVRGPLKHDAHLLYHAMKGVGTKENVLNDVLLGRSNADIIAIKSEYKRAYNRDLIAAVKDDLSLKTERHFEIVLSATRAEDSAPVIKADIDRDVEAIYRSTEGKIGHDSLQVCSIFSLRNDNQLRAIAQEYEHKYAQRLETVIRKEFSGHMEDALLYQLWHASDKYMHQAKLLEDAMAGAGTKDHLLVSRVVRSHWDKANLANVKGAYQTRYKRSLAGRIKGETSGDYERLMIACIGER